MSVPFNRFDQFSEDLAKAKHNLGSDVLKVMLTNTAPVASTGAIKADITEIAAANGYVAGGLTATRAFSRTGGVSSITGTSPVFTASGGSVGPFRYAVLYNDTQTSPAKPLIGWWDYGSAVTLADGESFTDSFGASMFTVG